jgi:hypothetical protein
MQFDKGGVCDVEKKTGPRRDPRQRSDKRALRPALHAWQWHTATLQSSLAHATTHSSQPWLLAAVTLMFVRSQINAMCWMLEA